MKSRILAGAVIAIVFTLVSAQTVSAIDGGTLLINYRNGWQGFEVITEGDDPTGDGFSWSMLDDFDGIGARIVDETTLRLQVNHETGDATISEVNLDLEAFTTAISNTIDTSSTGGGRFVDSARQAYSRWSDDGGTTWVNTNSTSNTSFFNFCSGQSYAPHTFGEDRGFVDPIYITGEESFSNTSFQRLFALDLENRDFYQLSGVTGEATGGLGGMPFDSWENAALLDTGETDHVALLLSPDGGTQDMKIYIGEKGKGFDGSSSNDFLARNGLAYGSYYFLNDVLPAVGSSNDGTFDTTASGALNASKHEDVDTSPSQPHRAVLGNQNFGLFTLDFDLDFSSGSFDANSSSFSIEKIQNDTSNTLNAIGDQDNVDWTAATALGDTEYEEGLIFVNEDNSNGEVWVNTPDGDGLTLVADTTGISPATETSGILDISEFVGYVPGSVLLTSNQGSTASLSVLINPDARLLDADYDGDGFVEGSDFLEWQSGDSPVPLSRFDLSVWQDEFGAASASVSSAQVPEPSCLLFALGLICSATVFRRSPLLDGK
ncbi:MAG: hypothetical protein RH917_04620 [Lacipirellulaceae bacterium]